MGFGRSSHRDEVEALRRRAGDFLELAREALRIENYDISCFLSEQAAQLHLKSVLLEEVGDYPRTHSKRTLLTEVSKSFGGERIREFTSKNRARLIALEDAYVIARYTPTTYTEEDAEDMIKLTGETITLTEKAKRK